MKSITIEELKTDAERIKVTIQQYAGALQYVTENIKRLEQADEVKEVTK